jgi:hypothetical protein
VARADAGEGGRAGVIRGGWEATQRTRPAG